MSEAIRQSILELTDQLEALLVEVAKKKGAINALHEAIGESPPYNELLEAAKKGQLQIRPDEFYNRPFATVVTELLSKKDGPMTVGEIVDGLKSGGFSFGNSRDAEHSVRTSLGKNTAKFIQIPHSDRFGLVSRYSGMKRTSGRRRSKATAEKNNKAKERPIAEIQPDDTEIEVAEREEQEFDEEQGSNEG